MDYPPEVQHVLDVMRLLGAIQRNELGPRMYLYSELSDRAKEVVRDRWREYHRDSEFLTEDVTDAFIYRLSELGYCSEYQGRGTAPDGLEVPWSLSSCQGDGVAFRGSPDDTAKVLKRLLSRKDFKLLMYEHRAGSFQGNCIYNFVKVEVQNNSRYTHYNSFNTEIGTEDLYYYTVTPRQEELLETIKTAIQEELVSLSHEFERMGNQIIEEQNEDRYIDEEIYNVWEDRKFYANGEGAD